MESGFESYLKGEKLKAPTIAQHIRNTGYFLSWLEKEGLAITQTTHREILDFIDKKRGENRSIGHINKILLSLRYYFACLNRENIMSGNPASGLRVKGAVRTVPSGLLEKEELDQLYESYAVRDGRTHRNKTMLGLLVYQGLTREELETLRPEHLKLREGKISIPGTNKNSGRTLELKPFQILDLQEYMLVIRPKILADQRSAERPGRKPREFRAVEAIKQLFTSMNGSENIKNSLLHLGYALKKINSKYQNATQIRQSVITEWLKEKGLRQVQYMAGHRYVSSTERYLTTNLEDLREALNKHHPLK